MLDYLPLIIGLISATIGIMGKSWDEKRKGLKKVTTKGWVTICLALVSFIFASWTIKKKNDQLKGTQNIQAVAHRQTLRGINYLIRSFVEPNRSNDTIFSRLADTTYLAEIGKTKIINPDSSGVISNGVTGDFIHPFELYASNIKFGENLLNDVILKYASVLSPDEIVLINNILDDQFYQHTFTLRTQKLYFEEAILDYKDNWKNNRFPLHSGWSYLGLYYFNRVYEGDAKRSGNFKDFLSLMRKIQELTIYINGQHAEPLSVFDESPK